VRLPDVIETGVARRGWPIWLVGSSVYLLAVFNRSTLGIAGPAAADRFGISASQLGTFVMLQVGVYAAMQIPAGLLIDRYGPRKMLLTAALVMAVGQFGFALAQNYPLALLSRGVLGSGDALTYVSVLRLVAVWFPLSRYALMSSLTGFFGIAGNVLATVPLALLLPVWGWGWSFGAAAALCVLFAAVLIRPGTVPPPYPTSRPLPQEPDASRLRRILRKIGAAWSEPGERLGFWVHFTAMVAPMVFAVLWGFPYLTEALGYSAKAASSVLLLMVALQLVLAVVSGWTLGRRPSIRVPFAVTATVGGIIGLGLFIGWPGGHPPPAAVIAAAVLLSLGTPGSGVAFLLARDYNPAYRMSTATGLANTGGWSATLIGVFVVGAVLDIVEPDGVHTTTGYRWAFTGVLLITLFGLTRLLTWWRRVRGSLLQLQAEGDRGPIVVVRHWFDQPVPR
jgi:MFS family permease